MAVGSRAVPDWEGTLSGLTEVLKDLLFTIRLAKESQVAADITALEVFDQLDRYVYMIKQEMGL